VKSWSFPRLELAGLIWCLEDKWEEIRKIDTSAWVLLYDIELSAIRRVIQATCEV